jgi:hypothetical protein
MPFEMIGQVTTTTKDEQARAQLVRVLRSSGLSREAILDLVDIAFRRRRQRVLDRRPGRQRRLER